MSETKFSEVKYFSDITSYSTCAVEIIKNATDLAMSAVNRDFSNKGVKANFSLSASDYRQKNEEVKRALLAFCGAQSGVREITEKKHLVNAFNNPTFTSIYNAIVAETLLGVVTNTDAAQLMALCNVDEVDIGESKTYNIETKGIPVAQRNSYNSNVVLLDGFSESGITITPKPYSLGSSIDYIRILGNGFDFGKELARVALGMLFAQYRLVAGILFNTSNLTGTPLYDASFDAATYTLIISYLQALNNANVKAYGTIPAYQKQGSTATTNYGFETQDEMIRNGFIGHAYGIDNIVIDQATDLSAPFVDANLSSLLLIPNNLILLAPDTGDKAVKLVRENFIKVISKDPKADSVYRQEYSYTMSFDAGLATQSHYALIGV